MIKMGGFVMKKIVLTLALLMSLNVFAQRKDGYFNTDEDLFNNRISNPDAVLFLPTLGIGSTANEQAPLGSGLIILTVLGASYSIRKRQKRLQTMQYLTSKQDLKVSHS